MSPEQIEGFPEFIRHITSYLTYGIQFQYSNRKGPPEVMDFSNMETLAVQKDLWENEKVIHKPILYPISQINSSVEINGEEINVLERLRERWEFIYPCKSMMDEDKDNLIFAIEMNWEEEHKDPVKNVESGVYFIVTEYLEKKENFRKLNDFIPSWVKEALLSLHIDVYGLIDKDEAFNKLEFVPIATEET